MYKCGWNGCEKAYGTLNHLNAHVTMQSHGTKRTPEGKFCFGALAAVGLSVAPHAQHPISRGVDSTSATTRIFSFLRCLLLAHPALPFSRVRPSNRRALAMGRLLVPPFSLPNPPPKNVFL